MYSNTTQVTLFWNKIKTYNNEGLLGTCTCFIKINENLF